jgi:CRP/FNR family transcriptional regulator, cyclic AMP receptor protein
MSPHPTIAAAAKTIRAGSFYEMLAEQDRARLRRQGTMRMHRPGAQLMAEGDPAPSPAVLIRGWAKSSAAVAPGAKKVLYLYGPGDIFGSEAAFSPEQRCAETVTAAVPCVSLTLPGALFAELLSANRGVAAAFHDVMLQRARVADGQAKSRFCPASERLVHLLLDLADRDGVGAPDGITIPVQLPQEELADMIGASRSAVARTLKTLRARGMVHTGYRRITITASLAALRQYDQRTSYLLAARS